MLEHILGHFKTLLSRAEKSELLEIIGDFARGLIPLVVPVTLLRHHTRRHDLPYLLRQSYLDPHPRELMLRNHGCSAISDRRRGLSALRERVSWGAWLPPHAR